MTSPRDLLRQYLLQQVAAGVRYVALPEPLQPDRPAGTPERPPSAPSPEAPPAAAGVATPGGDASPPVGTREPGPARRGRSAQARWDVDLPAIPAPGIVIPAPTTDLFEADPMAQAPFDEVVRRIHACTRCRLHAGRTQAVPGEGPLDARLVVVGEGPGANEDAQGRPFVGRAGELLNDILAAIDCPRETVYIANVVKCRPPDNRKPQGDEMEACMPYLHRQLALIRPKVVLAMGATAAEALLQTRGSLGQLRNRVHSYRGTPLVVTYHPAALLRNPNWKRPTWDDVRIARQLLDR